MRGHFEGDQMKYRDAAVTEEWKKKDCIVRMETLLREQGVMTDEQMQAIRAEISGKIDAAVAAAEASPEPTPEDLYRNLYAEQR